MLADAVTAETLNNLNGRFQAPIKSSIAKLRRQRQSAATEPADMYFEQQAKDKRIAQSKINPGMYIHYIIVIHSYVCTGNFDVLTCLCDCSG